MLFTLIWIKIETRLLKCTPRTITEHFIEMTNSKKNSTLARNFQLLNQSWLVIIYRSHFIAIAQQCVSSFHSTEYPKYRETQFNSGLAPSSTPNAHLHQFSRRIYEDSLRFCYSMRRFLKQNFTKNLTPFTWYSQIHFANTFNWTNLQKMTITLTLWVTSCGCLKQHWNCFRS